MRKINRQRARFFFTQSEPVVSLLSNLGSSHAFSELLRPPHEWSRLQWQAGALAALKLPVGCLEVFEQDPPGYGVNGQVMNDQE
jgi:hypothetical protein